MNKRTIVFLFLVLFIPAIAANPILNSNFELVDGNGKLTIETEGAVNYQLYPLNNISIIVFKPAVVGDAINLDGDGTLVKSISIFQLSEDPESIGGIIIMHDTPLTFIPGSDGVTIIPGAEEYEPQPDNVPDISKERYQNRLFELAEELFAVEKYDEATVMYNSIYAGEFYVPLYVVNQVRSELNMEPVEAPVLLASAEEAVEEEAVEEAVEEEPEEEFVEEEAVEEEAVEVVVEEPVEEEVIEEEPIEVVVEEPVEEEVIEEEPIEVVVEEPVEEEVIEEEPIEVVVEEPVEEEVIEEEPIEVVVEEPIEEVVEEEPVEEPVEVVVEEPQLNIINEINVYPEKEMTRIQVVADTKIMYEFQKNERSSSIEVSFYDSNFEGAIPTKSGYIKALSGNQFKDRYILTVAYAKGADVSIFPIDNIIEIDVYRPVEKIIDPDDKKFVQFIQPEDKDDKGDIKSQTLVEKRAYKGLSKISLHLKEASLNSLLRLISIETKVNIYSDPGIGGKINIDIVNQPWEPTLDVILKNYGLTYTWEGRNVIRVTNFDKLTKEKEMEKIAKESKTNLQPLITRIYQLSFAQASVVKGYLTPPLISSRGSVDSNQMNNILIVRDTQENLDRIDKLVKELDEETRQVNILVRIYRLNDITSETLGVNWTFNNRMNPSDVELSGGANYGADSSATGLASQKIGMFSLFSPDDMVNINMTLSALMSKNRVSLETYPNITTLNHQTASITIGQKVPITMLDEAGNTITQLTTVGTKIEVTPHINSDGKIILKIHPEISNLAGVVAGLVNIATAEANTTLIIDDGDTAVIGGLVEYRTTESKGFVPFLGKIPLLGLLFKNSDKTYNKGEILIFVTPKIVE